MIAALAAMAVGLVALTLAADRLVVAAVRVSSAIGISAVIIGAIVIGFGTSVPELVVSVLAGDVDRAMGNVVGSNVSNLTLVLGAAAVLAPITARPAVLRREGALMLGTGGLLALLLAGGTLQRWEGFVLLAAMVIAYGIIFRLAVAQARGGEMIEEVDAEVAEFAEGGGTTAIELLVVALTLAGTIASAWLLVWGAKRFAVEVGLTNAFVGLIILAIGTSLPELATSLAAARRGEVELIVGNVLGSNIFNSVIVAGIVGVAYPGNVAAGVEAAAWLGVVMAGVAGVFANADRPIARWEGGVLLAGFVALIALAL